jgi:hypothetical protein
MPRWPPASQGHRRDREDRHSADGETDRRPYRSDAAWLARRRDDQRQRSGQHRDRGQYRQDLNRHMGTADCQMTVA